MMFVEKWVLGLRNLLYNDKNNISVYSLVLCSMRLTLFAIRRQRNVKRSASCIQDVRDENFYFYLEMLLINIFFL